MPRIGRQAHFFVGGNIIIRRINNELYPSCASPNLFTCPKTWAGSSNVTLTPACINCRTIGFSTARKCFVDLQLMIAATGAYRGVAPRRHLVNTGRHDQCGGHVQRVNGISTTFCAAVLLCRALRLATINPLALLDTLPPKSMTV